MPRFKGNQNTARIRNEKGSHLKKSDLNRVIETFQKRLICLQPIGGSLKLDVVVPQRSCTKYRPFSGLISAQQVKL